MEDAMPLTKREFEDTVMELAKEQMFGMGNDGICLACHNVQGGCEPDARNYECESCGERKVFGAEELVLMGHGG
jgi:hypothetical protein